MGRFKDTATIKLHGVTFYGGPHLLAIDGEIAHGKSGTREVRLWLEPAFLAYLGKVAALVGLEPDPEHHGHMHWHVQNPEREFPCDQCSETVKTKAGKWAKRIAPAALLRRARP